mmetsp:Transcript_13728/g.28100  ORF Transcript_13728/g.28100 Transcript_13728/m.28100 type:complete len:278 (-) Transcript_13728:19-852(-)
MYSKARLTLEEGPTSRAPRNQSLPHYVSMIFPFNHFSRESQTLTKAEIASFRAIAAESFTLCVAPDRILSYSGVDQEQEGACTFVSILNLCRLMSREGIMSFSASSWKSKWRSFDRESCEDLAECLDLCAEKNLLGDTEDLRYIPIRSRGKRELCFNRSLWYSSPPSLASRYSVSESDVLATPWVYHNAVLIESLLDRGVAVVINFSEHSRTCVGYNVEELLFCDNWSASYAERCETGGAYEDVFHSGLSRCTKWAVYSWMRDIVFIEPREVIVIDD